MLMLLETNNSNHYSRLMQYNRMIRLPEFSIQSYYMLMISGIRAKINSSIQKAKLLLISLAIVSLLGQQNLTAVINFEYKDN